MPEPLRKAVTDVRFTAAPPSSSDRGLLGYVTFRIGDLRIDGVAVRRTRAGEIALSFPKRVDRSGRSHSFIQPVDDPTRQRITKAVIAQIDTHEIETMGGSR